VPVFISEGQKIMVRNQLVVCSYVVTVVCKYEIICDIKYVVKVIDSVRKHI